MNFLIGLFVFLASTITVLLFYYSFDKFQKSMKYKFNNKLNDFVINKYDIIEVESGDYNYNQRCHINALYYARKNGQSHVVVCTYKINGYRPHIHFLNYVNGKYIDNTVGVLSKDYEYRFVDLKDISGLTCEDMADLLIKEQSKLRDNVDRFLKYFE